MESAPVKKKSKLAIIGMLIVGFVAVIAIVILRSYSAEAPEVADQVNTNTQQNTAKNDWLALDESRLPINWNVIDAKSSAVQIRNDATNCFVSATSSANPADIALTETEQQQRIVGMIRSKGGQVIESTEQVSISTKSGIQSVTGLSLQVGGVGDAIRQVYVHITKNDAYTLVQLSCPSQADFTEATTAAQAITVLNY